MNDYTAAEVQKIIDYIEAGNRIYTPEVEGYSSWKVRNLLHRLNGMRIDTTYLEIGVHLGSTFIPAMYGNTPARGTAIDAWNMVGDLESRFTDNVKKYIPGWEKRVNIIHGDFRDVDISRIWSPVDVFFYDGDHGWDCQTQAFTYLAPVFADQFICLVDDVNWQEPREGTLRGINAIGATIEHSWMLKGPFNGVPPDGGENKEWWNSIYMAIVRK